MKFVKRIADSVHGTIELTELEARLLGTRSVQRLRNVKQLGLADLVYPGAGYSRLSHSLGVCHITGRTLAAVQKNADEPIDDREMQKYRLAGLLHDMGHYPFSHATENALKDHFASELVTNVGGASAGGENESDPRAIGDDVDGSGSIAGAPDDATPYYEHEAAGAKLLELDEEVKEILQDEDNEYTYEPREIWQVFAREQPMERFANLVSSDLDADRIDFLLRTSKHSGLPYGAVDLDYLLAQLKLDARQTVCISHQAVKTADHFLLGRYFDYQQVVFHKTVVGLEILLEDVVRRLLTRELVDLSAAGVRAMISSGDWSRCDDGAFVQYFRQIADEDEDEVCRKEAKAILDRNPPRLVYAHEHLGRRAVDSVSTQESSIDAHKLRLRHLRDQIPELANQFNISARYWRLWDRAVPLTKVGAHIPTSAAVARDDEESLAQAIHVLQKGETTSVPIMEDRRSLMYVLADQALYSIRLYVLLPAAVDRDLRHRIEAEISKRMQT